MLFETPTHADLLDKTGGRTLVFGLIDELIGLAVAQGCAFPSNFRDIIVEEMIKVSDTHSIMYQDYAAKRPMEIETYLGSPLKLAQQTGTAVPRLETLYPILHNLNIVNQNRPAAATTPPAVVQAPPRMSSAAVARDQAVNGSMGGPPKNGMRPSTSRAPSITGAPHNMRRGPGPMNGYGPRGGPNGYGPNGHGRRGSTEGNDLEEFSHLMLYDGLPEDGYDNANGGYGEGMTPGGPGNDLIMRERELQLRQRELALREREYNMRRGRGMPPPPASHMGGFDDDEDDDYFDPMAGRANHPPVDSENIDMMSVTSRRNRRGGGRPSMDMGGMPPPPSRGRNLFSRNKNRTSTRGMSDMPLAGDNIMGNPLMGYSSDRYGDVDRSALGRESRTNSLTAARLDELQRGAGYGGGAGGGAYPSMPRRASQSPGNPLHPGQRPPGNRPSPPNGYPHPQYMNGANGMNGNRPSPPNGMRQPIPRHPPGHGNAVAPHQVEQHAGVSNLYPPKKSPQVRSLTGSASASAESGDSGASAHLDSGPSAHSSASSLGPRALIGVRG
ncbi:MAG: hypothetical protein INR71_02325 [Terriglobus roseus]|nr:hypothetical protein [Terriglobus roseus]